MYIYSLLLWVITFLPFIHLEIASNWLSPALTSHLASTTVITPASWTYNSVCRTESGWWTESPLSPLFKKVSEAEPNRAYYICFILFGFLYLTICFVLKLTFSICLSIVYTHQSVSFPYDSFMQPGWELLEEFIVPINL